MREQIKMSHSERREESLLLGGQNQEGFLASLGMTAFLFAIGEIATDKSSGLNSATF